jgi:glutamine amidotransferase
MIAIVDIGLGNVNAIANIYRRLNIQATIASTPQELEVADKIILPGVGAFDSAMKCLDESGLRSMLEKMVKEHNKPVLGICVGMQIMANRSDEGVMDGLGWVPGEVKKIDSIANQSLALPHMGWNDVVPRAGEKLFKGLQNDARFYFLHSYCFLSRNSEHVMATSEYKVNVCAGVNNGNVYGVQFHPEKSHQFGIILLKNFAEI